LVVTETSLDAGRRPGMPPTARHPKWLESRAALGPGRAARMGCSRAAPGMEIPCVQV